MWSVIDAELCKRHGGLLALLACVHTATPRGMRPSPITTRSRASTAHHVGHSPPPRHHHWIMTAPAISRPSKTGTIIRGTSHSWSLNFWMVDTLTAFFCGGSASLSVTDSSQGWTVMSASRRPFLHNVERNRQGNGCKHRFNQIDRAPRAKLAIGCLSIHMTGRVIGFLQEGVSGDAAP
jgi:hypothetical protein